jgi:hypothetical protein
MRAILLLWIASVGVGELIAGEKTGASRVRHARSGATLPGSRPSRLYFLAVFSSLFVLSTDCRRSGDDSWGPSGKSIRRRGATCKIG